MAKQLEAYTFQGMQRDLSVSKHPSQFVYDALNVRFTAREDDTMLSITNEQGTKRTNCYVYGQYLGHTLLNKYLVVFTKEITGPLTYRNLITRIDLTDSDNPTSVILYSGQLNMHSPVDVIASYESEMIQKVYWTDGVNQPRIINISPDNDANIPNYTTTSFDFIPELALNETVSIKKILGGGGEFAPGVIQYAFTYYRKYSQETNIFYTSPLLYISYADRGASPEDKVDNVFKITVTGLDSNFDFLRIYSIQRTSINGTPITKRVQDIAIKGLTQTTFTDTGLSGNTVDPTELLYKGGESITAKTLEQKDNTLFFGNINLSRPTLSNVIREASQGVEELTLQEGVSINSDTRTIYGTGNSSSSSYYYANQLTAYNNVAFNKSVPCAGFKRYNTYRLGVQFQYKTGKWSDPIFLVDATQSRNPSLSYSGNRQELTIPTFKGNLSQEAALILQNKDYKKVRPVVVFPEPQDRKVTCQGVVCPTLSTYNHREEDKDITAQSSWFFRVNTSSGDRVANGAVKPVGEGTLPYTSNKTVDTPYYNPEATEPIRAVEIEGQFDDNNKFGIYKNILTLHTPDVEFDDYLATTDFSGSDYKRVGDAYVQFSLSDIDIQTETPTASNDGSGFVHKSFNRFGMYGIVSGLFYDDYTIDDRDGKPEKYTNQRSSCKWMVYLWNKDGSLNNDMNRKAEHGTATSILKKKVISNLRFATTSYPTITGQSGSFSTSPQLFSSDEIAISKLDDSIYMGNIDTMLVPDEGDGMYFAINSSEDSALRQEGIKTSFTTPVRWKTFSRKVDESWDEGYWRFDTTENKWVRADGALGDDFVDLVMKKDPVRMKYKSTPHIVCKMPSYDTFTWGANVMPIVEIQKHEVTPYGSSSADTLREHTWLPCGEPVRLDNYINVGTTGSPEWVVQFEYSYGDTYFQRYDCLKTYAFTTEDKNQVVEIGSFMVETYANIDGRYDRNRGQINNLNMSPRNFNLYNPVYSQRDNFFSYKIMDDDFYKNNLFPNQITWTKEKQSGADVDLWTNITLASTYDMDGSKGEVISLNTWKNQLYCFQQKGVSSILFNSRVQIPVSDGIPIEISNNYKVDGYNYLFDGIGCNNRRLIKETPSGIYFIDSIGDHLMHIGEGLGDIAEQCNMTTWFKSQASGLSMLAFDDIHHDLYLVSSTNKALCFSEKLNQFTGLYDYDNIELIESYEGHVFTLRGYRLFKLFEGNYGDFFGDWQNQEGTSVYVPNPKPWSLTFISNGSSNDGYGMDKTFTNLEFRASVEGDGELNQETGKFTPALPLDSLEVWNEYQHGIATLQNKSGHSAYQHHLSDATSALKRKFRIWRCDIPRNNADLSLDSNLPNCFRKIRKPLDRMRNPWLYVKLQKTASASMQRTEIHDLVLTYFS